MISTTAYEGFLFVWSQAKTHNSQCAAIVHIVDSTRKDNINA